MIPSVSVCIPFHNAEHTLLDCIRSVYAQTLTGWELILLDDGSTDGSLAIAKSVRDARVRVISSRHLGLAAALNTLARQANAAYIARMDADDLMHPLRLEQQVHFLNTRPEAAAVGAASYVIDAARRVVGIRAREAPGANGSTLRGGRAMHPTVMGRREWFLANPYSSRYPRGEDRELWCRTAAHFIGHISRPLLFYRETTGALGKYIQGCRTEIRIFAKYGPRMVGPRRTATLIAGGIARPLVYSAFTLAGFESRLLQARNQAPAEAEHRDALQALDTIASTVVPRHA